MEDGLVKGGGADRRHPAAKAEVSGPGDIHPTHIDDRIGAGGPQALNQAVERRCGGPVPTPKIRLKVMRKGPRQQAPRHRRIVRRHTIKVALGTQPHRTADDVRLCPPSPSSTRQTTDGLKKSIADISNQLGNDKVKGLRDRTCATTRAGLLDQAISVSDAPSSNAAEIVSTRGRRFASEGDPALQCAAGRPQPRAKPVHSS